MAPNDAVKLVLLGSPGVGKTQLVNTYSERTRFTEESRSTVGVDFCTATVTADDGTLIRVQVWDTAGQERFRTLQRQYYRGTSACMMVFSLTDKASFDALEGWYEDVSEACADAPSVLVVGNKSDLEDARVCSGDSATTWAAGIGAGYIETSAKVNTNVRDAFEQLIKTAYAQKLLIASAAAEAGTVRIDEPPKYVAPNTCCAV